MDLLDRLLGHDAWTTRLLLERCSELAGASLDTEFDIGRRTLRETLGHIVRNTDVWSALMAAGLEGNVEPLRCRAMDDAMRANPSIADLVALHAEASERLARVARAVAARGAWDETWTDTLDDPPTRKTYGGAIAHVITHSVHHRAQVLHMMRRLGMDDLPEGDALTWENRR